MTCYLISCHIHVSCHVIDTKRSRAEKKEAEERRQRDAKAKEIEELKKHLAELKTKRDDLMIRNGRRIAGFIHHIWREWSVAMSHSHLGGCHIMAKFVVMS